MVIARAPRRFFALLSPGQEIRVRTAGDLAPKQEGSFRFPASAIRLDTREHLQQSRAGDIAGYLSSYPSLLKASHFRERRHATTAYGGDASARLVECTR